MCFFYQSKINFDEKCAKIPLTNIWKSFYRSTRTCHFSNLYSIVTKIAQILPTAPTKYPAPDPEKTPTTTTASSLSGRVTGAIYNPAAFVLLHKRPYTNEELATHISETPEIRLSLSPLSFDPCIYFPLWPHDGISAAPAAAARKKGGQIGFLGRAHAHKTNTLARFALFFSL